MLNSLKKYRIIFALLIASLFIYGLEQNKKRNIEIKIIAKAPAELVELIEATEPIYIVNFFATWCGPCREEHHLVVKLQESSPLPIYGIAINDSPYYLERFFKKAGNPYKRVITNFNPRVLQELQIKTIPRTIIIASGNIIYDYDGPISKEHLAYHLLPLINKLYNF